MHQDAMFAEQSDPFDRTLSDLSSQDFTDAEQHALPESRLVPRGWTLDIAGHRWSHWMGILGDFGNVSIYG